jgi:hypothetical protein
MRRATALRFLLCFRNVLILFLMVNLYPLRGRLLELRFLFGSVFLVAPSIVEVRVAVAPSNGLGAMY